MKTTSKFLTAASALCAVLLSASALQGQTPVGQWDFESGNLSATVGTALTYRDGTGGSTQTGTQFGSTTALGIPAINGTNANVMKFPASDLSLGMGYSLPTPNANGGGSLVNDYTIIMDVLFPDTSNNKTRPILETDQQFLTSGADLLVDANNGIGAEPGPYNGTILPNTWYRIGFVVDTSHGVIRSYINGVEVGSQPSGSLDNRYALATASTAGLFANASVDTAAEGYVNSIQLRDAALTREQMTALGGPSAEGIPQTIPKIPSYIEQWTPSGLIANRNTTVSAVINRGETTVNTGSIVLKLDGVAQTGVTVTTQGSQISVFKTGLAPFAAGSTHTIEITYNDSDAGAKSFSRQFKATLLFEDFEGLALQDSVEEPVAGTDCWTPTPPTGWVTNHANMPGYGDPATDGRTEWAGWTFAKKSFWLSADMQTREQFIRATGTLAIADPDEWDDGTHPQFDTNGNAIYFTSFLATPAIDVTGMAPNSIFIKFDSSWRPEGFDDWGGTNNMTATVTVAYDGGAATEVLHWDSQEGGSFYHPDSQNEAVLLRLNNPAGATSMVVTFGLTKGANDWWWAFDNLEINAGPIAPSVTLQPQSLIVSTGAVSTFTVAVSGS
ncbi:MAG TPA: hypothetical protein VEC99_13765, partial [Clostridia bacterium]|nr:hypothetical protein [Clostridia bacterium]